MRFHEDAELFGKLSTKYREQVGREEAAKADATLKEIKNLIAFNAERIARSNRVSLFKRKAQLDIGSGIPMVALSIPQILSRRENLKAKHLTTLNTRSSQKKVGVNILLDYSGSMWFFDTITENTIDGVLRIHAQNFLALVYGVYLQKLSRGKTLVRFNCFSQTNKTLVFDGQPILQGDFDLLIVHKFWGSHEDGQGTRGYCPQFLPNAFKGMNATQLRDWFCNVFLHEAVEESTSSFRSKHISQVKNLLLTDGGMHRDGETKEDRIEFLSKTLGAVARETKSNILLIKTQNSDFKDIAKKSGIRYDEIMESEEYETAITRVFDMMSRFGR